MKPLIPNLIAAVTAKNGSPDNTADVKEKDSVWLNNTDLGDPVNEVILTTDGGTNNIRVTGASYVICWWKGSCVAVYFTSEADETAIVRAIKAGEPEDTLSDDGDTWDNDSLDGDLDTDLGTDEPEN